MKIKFKDKILGIAASIIATVASYTVAFLGAAGAAPLFVILPFLVFGGVCSFLTFLIITE
jgi:hypothetical protein